LVKFKPDLAIKDLTPETMTQLLKQGKNKPYDLADQVVVFWAGGKGYLDQIPTDKITIFEKNFLEYMHLSHKEILSDIDKKKIIEEKTEKSLKKAVEDFMKTFSFE
jgi:F-type H+-transporting ATPase subunit alpha